MMEPASIAFDNYCAYLSPTIEHWGIVFDGGFHQAIVRGLLARIKHATLLDLRDGPQPLIDFAREHIHDDRVGALEFLLNQPTFDLGYPPALNAAIGEFDNWTTRKLKLAFEVWDGNFEALFSEPSHDLQARCLEMHARISAQKQFSYSAAAGHPGRLDIQCHDVVWITQTGFEPHDYILPTGEVATCPNSLEGTVSLGGWLIGTIPFGAKYGFLSPGGLVLRFAQGQIAEVTGTHAKLCADFEAALAKFPTLRQVSEVGVGMSHAVASAARIHAAGHFWHERHLGFHIGLGARLPQTPHPDLLPTGPHLDLVFEHGALHAADGSDIHAW
jgi:hypothetical protein